MFVVNNKKGMFCYDRPIKVAWLKDIVKQMILLHDMIVSICDLFPFTALSVVFRQVFRSIYEAVNNIKLGNLMVMGICTAVQLVYLVCSASM